MKAKGYEWVALLLDDSGSEQEVGEYNRSIYEEYVRTFRLEGMKAGCWFTQGGSLYLTPSDSDLAIAECEGPGDYDGIVSVIQSGQLPSCPLAVVTNFSTITRERAKILINNNFTCLPEAYMNEAAHMTPPNMDLVARNLGWPTSQPVAGVYPVGGNPVPSYVQWKDWPLADYLGEYVI